MVVISILEQLGPGELFALSPVSLLDSKEGLPVVQLKVNASTALWVWPQAHTIHELIVNYHCHTVHS